MSEKLTMIPAIPSLKTAVRGKPLNVLGGVVNPRPEALEVTVTLWGRAESEWKALVTRNEVLKGGEHRHLYYAVPAECLEDAFWDGGEIEEIELLFSEEIPSDGDRGVLVFISGGPSSGA